MKDNSLMQRLRERKIVQWAIAYGAGALVLLEIADFLAEAFGWQAMTLQIISILVGFTFLVVLVIAWYHGDQGHQRVKAMEVLLLASIALTGGGTAWWMATRPAAAAQAGADARGGGRDLLMTSAMLPDDGRTGVAVLPFVTIGEDGGGESFADGMTEDIIAEVASVEGLRVISRTSVTQYRGTQKSIPEIARELGVDVILEGSVRRAGDEVRIVAQLIDASTDEHLWTKTYDENIRDILKVQSDVARDIAAQMRQHLGVDVQLATEERPEVDPATFRQMVEGRRLASSAEPEERQRGVDMLVNAVEKDSNLVSMALPALAEVAAPDMDPMHMFEPPAPPAPDVERAIQQAMRHAPTAPALRTISIRRALDANDFERAESTALQAIEENPNNASAHRYYGLLLGRQGRYDDGIGHLREARRLDPHSPAIGTELGEMLYAAGRPAEAVQQLEGVLRTHPQHVPARVSLGLALQADGRNERAVEELRTAARQSHGNPMVLGSLGYVFATQGAVGEARAVLDSLRMGEEIRGATTVAIAQVLSGLGRLEEAARLVHEATGDRRTAERMRFEWLRVDPKFQRIFADVPDDSTAARAPRRTRNR